MREKFVKEITSKLRRLDLYMLRYFEAFFGKIINIHHLNNLPNIFLFSTPRSGSTWLMELILTQNGFKSCNEPLDIRNPMVRRYLNINTWFDLYSVNSLEKIQNYFEKIINGELKHLGSNPFDKNFRFITNRIVFKIINGCEDKIDWFLKSFKCKVIFLIRHPIAVSLSRKKYPRLKVFITSDFKRHFSEEQIEISKKIIRSGSKLEKGVLSWCLQNSIPLRKIDDRFLLVTYEQLALEPEKPIKRICELMKCDNMWKISNRIHKPSWSVKGHSDNTTESYFNRNHTKNVNKYLIEKWKRKVSREKEKQLFEILEKFNIDIYEFGSVIPNQRYLIK